MTHAVECSTGSRGSALPITLVLLWTVFGGLRATGAPESPQPQAPTLQVGKLRDWIQRHPRLRQPHSAADRVTGQLRRMTEHAGEILGRAESKLQSGERPVQELELLSVYGKALQRIDGELRTLFVETEGQLKMAAQRNNWRQFDQHYQTRIANLLLRMEGLGNHPGPEQLRQLRDALEATVGEEPAQSRSMIGVSNAPSEAVQRSASGPLLPRLAEDEPTPADLAATTIVQLSPEIRAKAEALGHDPKQIFDWVYNNVELELYFGAMQSSQSVLLSRRAGDYDIATLLIALLRASGIPARYVNLTVRMDLTALKDLVGAKDADAALFMARQAYPLTLAGSTVDLDHVVVEAYLPGESGNRWQTLDSSFKVRQYRLGVLIPKIPWARVEYMSAVRSYLPIDAYLDQLRQYLAQNLPGLSLADLAYTGRIVDGTFPYQVVNVRGRLSELRAQDQHRVVLSVESADGRSTYLTHDMLLPQIVLQSVAVSVGSQTLGSPLPGAALTPQLRLDGRIVAAGSTALAPQANALIRVRHFSPGREAPRVNIDRVLRPMKPSPSGSMVFKTALST